MGGGQLTVGPVFLCPSLLGTAYTVKINLLKIEMMVLGEENIGLNILCTCAQIDVSTKIRKKTQSKGCHCGKNLQREWAQSGPLSCRCLICLFSRRNCMKDEDVGT